MIHHFSKGLIIVTDVTVRNTFIALTSQNPKNFLDMEELSIIWINVIWINYVENKKLNIILTRLQV